MHQSLRNQQDRAAAVDERAPARGLEDLSHAQLVALCRRMRGFIAEEMEHLQSELLEVLDSGCILDRATGKPKRDTLDDGLIPIADQMERQIALGRALLSETPDA